MLEEFVGAFEAVLVMVLLILTGFFLTKYQKVDGRVSQFISWVVVNVTLPCYMLHNVTTSFDPSEIWQIPKYIALPLVSVLIGYGLGKLIVKLAKVPPQYAGSMVVMTAMNNTIFMGLPVNLALFGEQSVPYVLYYYMANTLLFWTLGIYTISGGRKGQGGGKPLLARIFSPPLLGLLTGLLFLLLHIPVPSFLLDTCESIGAMTTPLSMIFIGYVLCSTGLSNLHFGKNIVLGLACRFLIGPLAAVVLFRLAPLPDLMRNVFTVQAFMPVMTNQAIIAKEYGADSEFPAVMVSVSTLVSLVLLPLIRVALGA